MSSLVGLDFETWSDVNLPEKGLENYVTSPNFKTLLASIVTEDGFRVTFDFVFGVIYEDGVPSSPVQTMMEDFYHFLVRPGDRIAAHNASFERRVLDQMFPGFAPGRVVDSAAAARALGAESKLEVASRQLTDSHKLETGHDLVMLFCVPNEYYPEGPTPELILKHGHQDKWMLFIEYCEMDARGSREIYELFERFFDEYGTNLPLHEENFELITYFINQNGWRVDVPLVETMKRRAWANNIVAQKVFLTDTGKQINFNSHKQMKEFCEVRGFTVKSLDKYNLPIAIDRVTERIDKLGVQLLGDSEPGEYPQIERALEDLSEVKALLETKQEIGGSTLSKLPVILNLVNEDEILKDQYMHIGAGQTFRHTGRGVQMQNLKKLDGNIRDVETLYDYSEDWSNGDMAGQLRQVFTSRHPEGELIVGDFSAVESRGLAYLAGEEWKLDAYREGKDIYVMLASIYFDKPYEEIADKSGDLYDKLRPRGKYSELSCGYQASGKAVQEFMFRLGFTVTEESAVEDVMNWRSANQNIVNFWYTLDDLLRTALKRNSYQEVEVGNGVKVSITPFVLDSIQKQHPGSLSLLIQVLDPDGVPYVSRIIHGCYFKKNGDRESICYYKPADRDNGGPLWKATYKHPKKKDKLGQPIEVYYSIYGGKLAGILTQSLCRELFMDSLSNLHRRLEHVPNALIIGLFHDEIVVDWQPSGNAAAYTKEEVFEQMRISMTQCALHDFPLTTEIKSSYRYTK